MHRTRCLSFLKNMFYGSPKIVRRVALAALALVLVASLGLPAAQKNKNAKKDKEVQQQVDQLSISTVMPLPDGQAIELMISQMLGAWQIGDEQALHTFYADDVLVVSGSWEPPLQGWQNYLRAFKAQRARTQGAHMDRTNTYTKVLGNTAWCTYQWEFTGQMDGASAEAVGQTTLMLEKRADKWLIVINHTSVAPMPQRAVPSSAAPQTLQPTSSPRAGATPGA